MDKHVIICVQKNAKIKMWRAKVHAYNFIWIKKELSITM